jgi:hypothetical protein
LILSHQLDIFTSVIKKLGEETTRKIIEREEKSEIQYFAVVTIIYSQPK